jgi:hypothetical protein
LRSEIGRIGRASSAIEGERAVPIQIPFALERGAPKAPRQRVVCGVGRPEQEGREVERRD